MTYVLYSTSAVSACWAVSVCGVRDACVAGMSGLFHAGNAVVMIPHDVRNEPSFVTQKAPLPHRVSRKVIQRRSMGFDGWIRDTICTAMSWPAMLHAVRREEHNYAKEAKRRRKLAACAAADKDPEAKRTKSELPSSSTSSTLISSLPVPGAAASGVNTSVEAESESSDDIADGEDAEGESSDFSGKELPLLPGDDDPDANDLTDGEEAESEDSDVVKIFDGHEVRGARGIADHSGAQGIADHDGARGIADHDGAQGIADHDRARGIADHDGAGIADHDNGARGVADHVARR